jgi:acetolactate synthase-1/3 small subunit
MNYTVAVLVENKPGVLTRISGLISRRAFNIESIAASKTEDTDMTRITIDLTVEDDIQLEQVVNQLSKLVEVIKIINLTHTDAIERELALIKVKASKINRSELADIVEIFRARIVDINRETVVIELTGEEGKINAFCEVLVDFGIIEIVRTGKIALGRGPFAAKEMA